MYAIIELLANYAGHRSYFSSISEREDIRENHFIDVTAIRQSITIVRQGPNVI